jgi:hypothetical protein
MNSERQVHLVVHSLLMAKEITDSAKCRRLVDLARRAEVMVFAEHAKIVHGRQNRNLGARLGCHSQSSQSNRGNPKPAGRGNLSSGGVSEAPMTSANRIRPSLFSTQSRPSEVNAGVQAWLDPYGFLGTEDHSVASSKGQL